LSGKRQGLLRAERTRDAKGLAATWRARKPQEQKDQNIYVERDVVEIA
jgi:hypothetical protein